MSSLFALPPLPSWDGLHPLIIHFPLALLPVAPLLVVAGLAVRRAELAFSMAALLLMVLGTAAAFLAASTGEAAAELAEKTPDVRRVLEQHEELAETVRVIFAVLTGMFAAIHLVPLLLRRKLGRRLGLGLHALFLTAYLGGIGYLANTAHQGGRLVHELGVRALMN